VKALVSDGAALVLHQQWWSGATILFSKAKGKK